MKANIFKNNFIQTDENSGIFKVKIKNDCFVLYFKQANDSIS